MRQASALSPSESAHAKNLWGPLSAVLGASILPMYTNKLWSIRSSTAPGIVFQGISATVNGLVADVDVPLVVVQGANEPSDTGCDPAVQAALSMQRLWLEKPRGVLNMSCCPTLLIVLEGPRLSIIGAILTDKWVVQRLSSAEYLGENSTFSQIDNTRISRVMHALRLAIEELGLWYTSLPTTTTPSPRCFYPEPTAYPAADPISYLSEHAAIPAFEHTTDNLVEFQYLRVLRQDDRCAAFLAQTTNEKQIVVKFVDRYGLAVHKLLADTGQRLCSRRHSRPEHHNWTGWEA
ncbi:hypothetical protein PENSPDRAFT_655509 [Peniophora sp. CONT]|nr:hypothetical protein PENSPDRAFT_655509 [Peniophora sp. CONT]